MDNRMDKKLTDKIFKRAREMGADVVSACSTVQMEKYPDAKEEISKIDPGARSFLIVGMRMVSSSIAASKRNIRIAQFSTKLLYDELNRAGFALMRELDDAGFSASPIPTHLPVPMQQDKKGLIAELSLRHIAYEAGLGSIGKNGLLITPEFGPRLRFLAILTSADLVAGRPVEENYCTECDLCVEACPTGALKLKGEDMLARCVAHHMKFGLPGVTRFGIKLIKAAGDDEKINLVKSPDFWEIWQNLTTGVFYYCFDCLNSCPVGK
jgi:epoxyqueuosine reductase